MLPLARRSRLTLPRAGVGPILVSFVALAAGCGGKSSEETGESRPIDPAQSCDASTCASASGGDQDAGADDQGDASANSESEGDGSVSAGVGADDVAAPTGDGPTAPLENPGDDLSDGDDAMSTDGDPSDDADPFADDDDLSASPVDDDEQPGLGADDQETDDAQTDDGDDDMALVDDSLDDDSPDDEGLIGDPESEQLVGALDFGSEIFNGAGGRAIAFAPNGDVLVGGSTFGDFDFGGGTVPGPMLEGQLVESAFLVRLSNDGSYQHNLLPPGSIGEVMGIAIDSEGNVIATGGVQLDSDMGGGPLPDSGGLDIFVAKFGSDGSHIFSKRFGNGDFSASNAIALDAEDNVYVACATTGAADFDGEPSGGTAGNAGVLSLAPDGSVRFFRTLPGTGSSNIATAIAVSGDTVSIAGGFTQEWATGDESQGSLDVFFADFDLDGAPGAQRAGGTAGLDYFFGMTAGTDQDLWVAGEWGGEGEFAGRTIGAAEDSSPVIVRLDGDSNATDANVFAEPGVIGDIEIDPDGRIHVVGLLRQPGTQALPAWSMLSADGEFLDRQFFGFDGSFEDIAIDPSGKVWLTGINRSRATFGADIVDGAVFLAWFELE